MNSLELMIRSGQKDQELGQIIKDLKAFKKATGLSPGEENTPQVALGRQAILCAKDNRS